MSKLRRYPLNQKEFLHFCDLLICGSEMSEYLIKNQNCSHASKRHAVYWQKLAKEFKPFLKQVLTTE